MILHDTNTKVVILHDTTELYYMILQSYTENFVQWMLFYSGKDPGHLLVFGTLLELAVLNVSIYNIIFIK